MEDSDESMEAHSYSVSHAERLARFPGLTYRGRYTVLPPEEQQRRSTSRSLSPESLSGDDQDEYTGEDPELEPPIPISPAPRCYRGRPKYHSPAARPERQSGAELREMQHYLKSLSAEAEELRIKLVHLEDKYVQKTAELRNLTETRGDSPSKSRSYSPVDWSSNMTLEMKQARLNALRRENDQREAELAAADANRSMSPTRNPLAPRKAELMRQLEELKMVLLTKMQDSQDDSEAKELLKLLPFSHSQLGNDTVVLERRLELMRAEREEKDALRQKLLTRLQQNLPPDADLEQALKSPAEQKRSLKFGNLLGCGKKSDTRPDPQDEEAYSAGQKSSGSRSFPLPLGHTSSKEALERGSGGAGTGAGGWAASKSGVSFGDASDAAHGFGSDKFGAKRKAGKGLDDDVDEGYSRKTDEKLSKPSPRVSRTSKSPSGMRSFSEASPSAARAASAKRSTSKTPGKKDPSPSRQLGYKPFIPVVYTETQYSSNKEGVPLAMRKKKHPEYRDPFRDVACVYPAKRPTNVGAASNLQQPSRSVSAGWDGGGAIGGGGGGPPRPSRPPSPYSDRGWQGPSERGVSGGDATHSAGPSFDTPRYLPADPRIMCGGACSYAAGYCPYCHAAYGPQPPYPVMPAYPPPYQPVCPLGHPQPVIPVMPQSQPQSVAGTQPMVAGGAQPVSHSAPLSAVPPSQANSAAPRPAIRYSAGISPTASNGSNSPRCAYEAYRVHSSSDDDEGIDFSCFYLGGSDRGCRKPSRKKLIRENDIPSLTPTRHRDFSTAPHEGVTRLTRFERERVKEECCSRPGHLTEEELEARGYFRQASAPRSYHSSVPRQVAQGVTSRPRSRGAQSARRSTLAVRIAPSSGARQAAPSNMPAPRLGSNRR